MGNKVPLMSGVETVSQKDLEDVDSASGFERQKIFETEDVLVAQAHATGGSVSDWHTHGDRHSFAYIVSGENHVEYGPGGSEVLELTQGDFLHMEPGEVHRYIIPEEKELVGIVWLVGEGRPIIKKDGPRPG